MLPTTTAARLVLLVPTIRTGPLALITRKLRARLEKVSPEAVRWTVHAPAAWVPTNQMQAPPQHARHGLFVILLQKSKHRLHRLYRTEYVPVRGGTASTNLLGPAWHAVEI